MLMTMMTFIRMVLMMNMMMTTMLSFRFASAITDMQRTPSNKHCRQWRSGTAHTETASWHRATSCSYCCGFCCSFLFGYCIVLFVCLLLFCVELPSDLGQCSWRWRYINIIITIVFVFFFKAKTLYCMELEAGEEKKKKKKWRRIKWKGRDMHEDRTSRQ